MRKRQNSTQDCLTVHITLISTTFCKYVLLVNKIIPHFLNWLYWIIHLIIVVLHNASWVFWSSHILTFQNNVLRYMISTLCLCRKTSGVISPPCVFFLSTWTPACRMICPPLAAAASFVFLDLVVCFEVSTPTTISASFSLTGLSPSRPSTLTAAL